MRQLILFTAALVYFAA